KIFRCVPAIEKNSKHVPWESPFYRDRPPEFLKKHNPILGDRDKSKQQFLMDFKNCTGFIFSYKNDLINN
ncbi:MAG TPA: hypothetical protein PK771_02575, partial [Spirochaetota bacterium]|nr:hypothetical protein [Spirochaetota bacterium]